MANTLDSLAEVIFRLIKESAFKMFVVIAGFILLAFITILLFDRVTATFSLYRIDKSLTILERLNQLDTTKNTDLEPIKKKLITDLNAAVDPEPLGNELFVPSTTNFHSLKFVALASDVWLRFLSGMSPWLLVSLFGIKQIRQGDKNGAAGFFAVIFVGFIAGLFGFLLPGTGWLFYILYPLGQIFCLILLGLYFARKNTNKTKI